MAVTPESFLEVLEKSRLLSAEQFAEAQRIASEVNSKDPRAVAKALVLKDVVTRWQAAHLLAGRSAFFMGKYKLIDQIGRGGMGGVFLVEHTMMNRTAALKVISRQLGKDPALLERFLTEARAIAALDHPNIAHAYDVDKEGDRYYLVMEYVEGQDLQRMVEEGGPLECQQAADYVRQAAEGLAHAHAKGMIHCDIKPANLLVNRQGVVKILDMGMARLVGRDQSAAEADDRFLGTVDYMAPEQALESPSLDHRVDIYSLGCTLYYLLTGHAPFPEGSIHERLLKHQTREPRSIADERPAVPKDLIEICRKMMAKAPADRYQTAEEVSRVLAAWQPPPSPRLKRAVPLEEAEAAGGAGAASPGTGRPAAVQWAGTWLSKIPGASKIPVGWMSKIPTEWISKIPLEKLHPALGDRRRKTWIGGGGLAVVLLLGVVLVWAMVAKSRHGEEAVADKGATTVEEEASTPSKEPAETADTKKRTEPEEKTPAETKTPPAADAKEKPTEKAATASSGGDKPADSKAAKEPPKSSDKGDKSADKATEKAAEKGKGETKSEKPAEKPKSGDAKADAKTDAPKPAEGKAEEKPKEPAPPTDPFTDFPTAVDLPDEPGELGKIHTTANVAWELDLENGDKVLRGSRQFTKPEPKEEDGKPGWVVQLNTPSPSKDKEATLTDVAKFWREGESLRFQWLEGAPPSVAGLLRLCTLKVRAAGNERSVAMLKPATVKPLEVNLDRASSTVKVALPWLPDSTKTRVQITRLDGFKDYKITPEEPVALNKKIVLEFTRKDARTKVEQKAQELVVLPSAKGPSLSFNIRLSSLDPAFSMAAKAAMNPAMRDVWNRKLEELNRSLEKADSLAANKRREYEMQADIAGRQVWNMEFYIASKTARIHYQVFAEVGEQKVELANTGAAAAALPGAKP